jgi:predicted nucleic acid-binding protein
LGESQRFSWYEQIVMTDKLTIDSSVFLSALLPDDPHRLQTLLFFQKLAHRQPTVILPTIIVCEVTNILEKTGYQRVSSVTKFLGAFQLVPLNEDFVESALPFWKKFALKTADAIIAVTCLLHRSTLVTWDRRLITKSTPFINAITPNDYRD